MPSAERHFDPKASWSAGIRMTPPVTTPPSWNKDGLLQSFGENARRLVSEHFTSRLQITVNPDDKTSVATTLNPGWLSQTRDAEQAVVQVSILDDGPLGFGAAMYSGEEGSFEAHTACHAPGGLSAFLSAKGILNSDDIGQDTTGKVGVSLDLPAIKLWGLAKSSESIIDFGSQFHCGMILQHKGVKIGAEGDLTVGEDSDGGIQFKSKNSNDPLYIHASNVSVRGVYSGAVPGRFASAPESFQIGISLEDGGRKVCASYFHAIEIAKSSLNADDSASSGMLSFGGEYTQGLGSSSTANEIILGSAWQASNSNAFKARLSSRGYADMMAAAKLGGIGPLFPVVNIAVSIGASLESVGDWKPRFGCSMAIGK